MACRLDGIHKAIWLEGSGRGRRETDGDLKCEGCARTTHGESHSNASYLHAHIHTYINTYRHARRTNIYTYRHAHIHTYIHTNTHPYTYTNSRTHARALCCCIFVLHFSTSVYCFLTQKRILSIMKFFSKMIAWLMWIPNNCFE